MNYQIKQKISGKKNKVDRSQLVIAVPKIKSYIVLVDSPFGTIEEMFLCLKKLFGELEMIWFSKFKQLKFWIIYITKKSVKLVALLPLIIFLSKQEKKLKFTDNINCRCIPKSTIKR